jgi:hypothetical protein
VADAKPPVASGDAAWVSLPVPLAPAQLVPLLRDVEAIFRANPYYEFHRWQALAPGHYAVELRNHSNERTLTAELEVSEEPLTVTYSDGLKRRTVFAVEPAPTGSRLTVTDDYDRLAAEERAERLEEVDRSLNAWGEALRVYFARQRRWAWLPGWRWYLRRVWVPMKPSARRIVWLLCLFTAAEFFFLLFVVLIWSVESAP